MMLEPTWVQALTRVLIAAGAAAALAAAPAAAARPMYILDTDIGDDIDDAYALALLASRPDVSLLGVTTTFGQTAERQELAAKLLARMGRSDVPVCAGRRGSSPIRRQYDWARGYRGRNMRREGAVEFMAARIRRHPGLVTLICIGPLTNIGDLLKRHPDLAPKVPRIVLMGGSVFSGYAEGSGPEPEWNIRCDPDAARAVFASGIPIVMAGLEVTAMMRLDIDRQKAIYARGTPATDALSALTTLWGGGVPVLYDAVAVAFALGHSFSDSEPRHIEVDATGLTRATEGTPNATVLVRPRKDAFLDWFVDALAPHPPAGA